MKEFGPLSTIEEVKDVLKTLSVDNPESLWLFRGQTKDYPKIVSGRARQNVVLNTEFEKGWISFVARMLDSDTKLEKNLAFAILQHYGIPTFFLDLTKCIETALWFATNKYNSCIQCYVGAPARFCKMAQYDHVNDGIGVIYVFRFDDVEGLMQKHTLFDLTHLPDGFLRPKNQQGWLLRHQPPAKPNPEDFCEAKIMIDRTKLTSSLAIEHIFPGPHRDPAYGSLLSTPYIQIPAFDPKNEDECLFGGFGRFAKHILDVEIYENKEMDFGQAHKWNDITLIEPASMRQWQYWRFPLEDHYEGMSGCISNTIKITMADHVRDKLAKNSESCQLKWPDFSTNDLLFTFAENGHDKVIDYAPPFHGVWLHRENDLIMEHPVIVEDEDKGPLTVCAGHLYRFDDGEITRLEFDKSCECGDPEIHDRRVEAMLRLSDCIDKREFSLSIHPMFHPKWYVAF